MASSINKRLKEYLDGLDDTYKEISSKTGIPVRTIYNLTEEGASIKFEYLQKIASIYGLNINEFAMTGTNRVNEDIARYSLDIDEEFTRIPYLRGIKAGAGYGLIQEEHKTHYIAFRHYFVQTTLGASATELLALRIGGNSMEPIIMDGDDILVDRARRKIKEGAAFLIRIDEEVFVKYLSKLPGQRLKVWSENRHFESFEVGVNDPDFEVIGQVVWHAHVSDYL